MRLLLIDNFDSFVFNLAQAFGALGADPIVRRNDTSLAELEAIAPDAVVISPGPGHPSEAGVSVDAIVKWAPRLPILGVCLGHQCIATAFGGRIDRAEVGPVHGKTSEISHNGDDLFAGLPSPFVGTRYHSLALNGAIPPDLVATARAADGTLMSIRHKQLPVFGVQFHPESVLSTDGPRLLANFLSLAAA